jgi:hypothetical protein
MYHSIQFQPQIRKSLNLVRKALRFHFNILSVPAFLTFLTLEHPWVEKSILYPRYQRYVNHYKAHLPKLSPVAQKILTELNRTGICISNLAELGYSNTDHFCRSSLNLFQDLRNGQNASIIQASPNHFRAYPQTFTWGVQPEILNLVTAYLGTPPAYDGPSYFLSQPDNLEVGARVWHRDREDRKMLKIIIYFSDVDESSGPFQWLTPDYSDALADLVSQHQLYRYHCFTHRELQQTLPTVEKDGLMSCTGKAGIVIFLDSARLYHRGKPPSAQPRSAAIFSYFSRRPWHPFFCERTGLSPTDLEYLTQNCTDSQKACAFWKQNLPQIARCIPRYQR